MLCLALGQHGKEFGVAGPAVLGLDIIGILDVARAMRLVAAQAVLVDHGIGMGLVAFQAFFDLLMLGGVAEGAILGAVLAGEVLELVSLLWMAGLAANAHRRHVVDRDIARGVRVTMAGQAVREFEVLTAVGRVAHGALRDGLGAERQMLKVTVTAGDRGLVLSTVALNVGGLAIVAFYAVRVLQLCLYPSLEQGLLLGAGSLLTLYGWLLSRLTAYC